MNWYEIENIESVDSPSLVIYEEFLNKNLDEMIAMVDGNTNRLWPHVKTNKMGKVIEKMVSKGIFAFKSATIAEAELAAQSGAKMVLIAHQLVGPKIERLMNLKRSYPYTEFASLIDDPDTAILLNSKMTNADLKAKIFIDINNGMGRSGISTGEKLDQLTVLIQNLPNLKLVGFHVYDGHLRESDIFERKENIKNGIKEIEDVFNDMFSKDQSLVLVAGGTPTFSGHVENKNRICSPGTCVLWDWGYGDLLLEQKFYYAALVISRIISIPGPNTITTDMGHKAVSSENPIDKRIRYLNHPEAKLVGQSEEHGVVHVKDSSTFKVGDVLYGVPYHVCPTVNLYDEAFLVKHNKFVENWPIAGRRRKINF